jgi:4-amino-4-deoxy-L-arabinose transferase-like glycosyltransferase
MRARLVSFPVVLAALVAGALLWSLGGLETRDESWFLQVTARVADGDVLYRDVFYATTPLPVYVTLPFVWLLGAQAFWVKALVAGCFAASLLLLVRIGRKAGATNLELAAAGAVLLVLALPVRAALYQPLAAVLVLGCLAAALAWCESGSTRTLALAGVLGGLAFASKQNVGLFAAVALLAAVLLAGGRLRALVVATASFAGAVALTLVPVAATGGLHGLWDYGFMKREEFIDRAAISYRQGFDLQWQAISQPAGGLTGTATAAVRAYELLAFVLVPVVLVALVVAWRRTRGADRKRVVIVLGFTLAAVASVYPRADISHVSFVVPMVVVGALFAARSLVSEPRLRTAALVLLVVFAPAALARGLGPVVQLAQDTTTLSSLPHTRGVAIEPAVEERLALTADALAAEPGPVFLATSEAGILYLVSGVENVTPYDYPLATTFGNDGEERLAQEIEQGRFAAVCLNFSAETDLMPNRLVEAIENSLVPGEDTGACRIYRRP